MPQVPAGPEALRRCGRDSSIRSMSAGDLALFLCVHGAYHVWCCAKWLSDVARAHSIGRIDWRAAMDEARGSGVEAVCPAALSLLHEPLWIRGSHSARLCP